MGNIRVDEVIQQEGQDARMLKEALFESLHVALPGEVVSYNKDKGTATIQPTIRNWRSKENPPMLMDVPVFQVGSDPKPGDGCLVVFADRCIDAWVQSGGVSNPVSARQHDLSDGFAFVGFKKAIG